MRLAIVSQQGRKASGAEHALLQFVNRLPPSVDVEWFFLEDGEFAAAIRRQFTSVTVVKMSDRVANAERGGLPFDAVFDSLSVAVRLARTLKRAKPDLVLTNSMKAHIIGSLAAKVAGLRCVNYIHDIVEGRALTLLRTVSRLCAVERLTCSKLVKDHLALPRTTVVYAAIEVAKFAELPDRDQARRQLGLPVGDVPIVGLVGRIARWKGQDRFIRIAANVLARRDAHFCIIGSPIFGCDMEYVEGLHADVKQRHLEPYMTFVPWQESMEHVYAAIDIACNVSTREPFGRTTLEALASGVPSICFDDAGVCEIFERQHGASQVAAGNETAFASAILDYLTEPERLARARDGARQIARQMDISRAYAEFVAAIERSANVAPRSAEPSGAIDTSTTASAPDGRQDDECLVS